MSVRARAQASAFLAGARNRARKKRQERIHSVLELPGTWLSVIRPALVLCQKSSTYDSRPPISSLHLLIGCCAYPKLEV